MPAWTETLSSNTGGRFQVVITKRTAGGRPVDVTEVRGAPSQVESFSDADPFGDSTAVITFPAITAFDDLDAADLGLWLGFYSDVDIYWMPALPGATPGYTSPPVLNPLSQKADLITPVLLRDAGGAATGTNRVKVWEGLLISMGFTADRTSSQLQIQCQGALFQNDHYLQKPFYPPQPWPLELLILDALDSLPGGTTRHKPHLRTATTRIRFPVGWKKKVPAYTDQGPYTPVAKPGTLWTKLTSRQTGSWEHTLTGYVQDLLTAMITDQDTGVTPGNQWTVRHYHEGEVVDTGLDLNGVSHAGDISPGRLPVLQVRDRLRTPDFSVWTGMPGLEVNLTGDATQSANLIYGDGIDIDGTGWRNAAIATDGSRTDYLPLAASHDVYPYDASHSPPGAFVSEAYTKFGAGFSQEDGISIAGQQLSRDINPGYSGTITLSSDPSAELSRWRLHAGMTVLLKGFAGTGEVGLRLHISSTEKNVTDGSVQLTVDSRYRDLLTVEESIARTRDQLTPVKMLQINKASVMIEDIRAPWDYRAGSGFIPRESRKLYADKPQSESFPYVNWLAHHPPSVYSGYYVKCNAASPVDKARWSGPIQILTSAQGYISRTEIIAVDYYGRPIKLPFHVSFYYVNCTVDSMPRLHGYSAFQNNAFETVDPATGEPLNPWLMPVVEDGIIIGWGNQVDGVMNRAGFWPGKETDNAPATGLLVDDASWHYDNTSYHQYFAKGNPPGSRPKSTDISIYAMFYAEWTSTVYFTGRLYHQNPGASN